MPVDSLDGFLKISYCTPEDCDIAAGFTANDA